MGAGFSGATLAASGEGVRRVTDASSSRGGVGKGLAAESAVSQESDGEARWRIDGPAHELGKNPAGVAGRVHGASARPVEAVDAAVLPEDGAFPRQRPQFWHRTAGELLHCRPRVLPGLPGLLPIGQGHP